MTELNPFMRSTGNPPRAFAGRKRELQELTNALDHTKQGMPEHIIFFGPFGIGKTSLLIEFQKRVRDAKAVRVPLYTTDEMTDICDVILRESKLQLRFKEPTIQKIRRSLSQVGFSIVGSGVSLTLGKVEMNPQSAFKELIGSIYDCLEKDSVLVLMIDDLHRIIEAGGRGSATSLSILSNALLSLNQMGRKIMFVGTGSSRVFEELRSFDESSVRIFHPCEIGPLSPEEVKETIERSTEDIGVRFSEDAIGRIYELSRGNPYYVQILSYYSFEERKGREISVDSFNEGFLRALNELTLKEFRRMYEDLSPGSRKILAKMTESDSERLSYTKLQETGRGVITTYLGELLNKEVIVRNGRGVYRIRDNLFAQYLHTYKPYLHDGSFDIRETTKDEDQISVMEHSRELKVLAKKWKEDLEFPSPTVVIRRSPDVSTSTYSVEEGEVAFEIEKENLFEDLVQKHLPKKMRHLTEDFSSLKKLLRLYHSKIESLYEHISRDSEKETKLSIGNWGEIGKISHHFPYWVFVSAVDSARERRTKIPAYSTHEAASPSPRFEIWCGETGIGIVRTRKEAEKLKQDHERLCRSANRYEKDAFEIVALQEDLERLKDSMVRELKKLLHYPRLPGDCEYLSPS